MNDGANRAFLPLTARNSAAIVRGVLEWFAGQGREFVWRSPRPGDPYLVFLSEMMLQQTQTARVTEKLPDFLKKFPTVQDLASASQAQVIRAWQGMGYNRRALNMHSAAKAVADRFGGRFPDDYGELRALPGIGDYTARAILCFAYGKDVAVVDVNIRRVLSRVFFKCHARDQILPESTILRLAEAIVPARGASQWHQALMDIGSTICTARNPKCDACPMAMDCLSKNPLKIELFSQRHVRKPEPALRQIPRRIWRGRLIEGLRRHHRPVRISELIDEALPGATLSERKFLTEFADMLLADGLIRRAGTAVREQDGLREQDEIELPE